MAEKGDTKFSEPTYAQRDMHQNAPWYPANIDKRLIPATSRLLEEYSGIPRDQQSEHVHRIREKAWAIRIYPCTGLGVWLVPYIRLSPVYDEILHRLKDGESMLDVGCFIAGDFRALVFDGAPSDNMLGTDIADHWDVGFELFRDRDRFRGRFLEADLMAVDTDAEPQGLRALKNRVNIIHISQVLHQWDWHGQLSAIKKLISFSKSGTLVVGFQVGSAEAKETQNPHSNYIKQWRHDPASFEEIWRKAGIETATKWKVQAWVRRWECVGLDADDVTFMMPGDVPIDFVVERLA